MKLQSYQLCRWCDRAVHDRRRWLWLAGNVLLLLLALVSGLAALLLPILLLANAVLALYLLHRHHAFGAVYQRTPRPTDAQCETVLIDAALIGQGTRLRAAAQPIDVADALSLRLGSGALLLGSAMTLTADELPPADRAAILSAVRTLNIKPSRMRSQYPVMRREEDSGLYVVTVRDGMSSRRYYLGEPDQLARRCPSIWEGHTRPLTEHDRTRIADTARYISQANCRVMAWATALEAEEPIFLGMAGVGEDLHMNALQDISALRAMGLTIMLDAGDQPDTDLAALRTVLDLPDHHARADLHLTSRQLDTDSPLGITRVSGESLVEPVVTLRHRFHTIEDTLRRFTLLLIIPLALSLLFGCWPAAAASAAMLLYTAIALGVDLSRPAPRWQTLVGLVLAAIAAKAFLMTQPAPLSVMAGGIIAVVSALGCCLRLGGTGVQWKAPGLKMSLPLSGAAALYVLIAVLLVLSEGASLLLPLGFAVLIAAVMVLLLLCEHVIFK
ncbi:MAG: hypothetical protein IJD99_09720 [Clostridia bacterium]|nr:hypothetical protein [Clostridia bacterium]